VKLHFSEPSVESYLNWQKTERKPDRASLSGWEQEHREAIAGFGQPNR